jgi:hypothetical protein
MATNDSKTPIKQYFLVLGGAMIGGALGVLLTWFLSEQGMRAGAAPGGLLGLGAGLARHRSIVIPIVCCIAALVLGMLTEWWLHYFLDDPSLQFFLQHFMEKHWTTHLMIALGGVVGFWAPYRAMNSARSFRGGIGPTT